MPLPPGRPQRRPGQRGQPAERQELKDARQELKDAKRKHADSLKRVREGSAKDLANAEAVWGAEQRQARAETITELRDAELEGFKRGHAFRVAELQGRG